MQKDELEIEIYSKILEIFPDEEKYNILSPYFSDAARNIVKYLTDKLKLKFIPSHDELVNKPYIEISKVITLEKYNPMFGDDRICECGHKYYRHFDSYEDMNPSGCKYCVCFRFKEKK